MAQGLVFLALVCTRIFFSPYIVAVICLINVLLSEINNNDEAIEKVFL
jgi:hypothetical protein